jgi:hypothetical protein
VAPMDSLVVLELWFSKGTEQVIFMCSNANMADTPPNTVFIHIYTRSWTRQKAMTSSSRRSYPHVTYWFDEHEN